MEIWKPIKNYEGIYEASNKGRIKSFHRDKQGKILKISKDRSGYIKVVLCKGGVMKGLFVHRIVYESFNGDLPLNKSGYVIDHIDNNKLNNTPENLQKITQRLNSSKDKKGFSSRFTGVHFCRRTEKWVAQIQIKGKTVTLCRTECEGYANIKYKEALRNLEE